MVGLFPCKGWRAALREILDAEGWDGETGYPSVDKLESLDLDWVAKELWPES